jgi:hypothetical protein
MGIVYEDALLENTFYPCVLYDANCFGTVPCNAGTPKYKMWYSDDWNGGTYLVTSTNGLTWGSPVQIWADPTFSHSDHVQVLYDANCFGTCVNATTPRYRMWFWDTVNLYGAFPAIGIETADSPDGVTWSHQQSITQNPSAKLVQDPDSGIGWNRGTYGPVYLFYQPSASNTGVEPFNYSYVMYYDGTDGSHEYTGLAYSLDGLSWSAYAVNPVLDGSSVGGWDCYSDTYGTVYKDSEGFHYFYSGQGLDIGGVCNPSLNGSFNGLGFASSTDGKTWVKSSSNPIFDISDGVYSQRVYTPRIVDDGSGVLKMYYTASDDPTGEYAKIGLAVLH